MKLEKGQMNKKDVSIITEDLGDRSVQFTISKEVVDRDGDILRASGVDFSNGRKLYFIKKRCFRSYVKNRKSRRRLFCWCRLCKIWGR